MLKKLKTNKKKGFTLVELIVVLVILAILAALLIPALTGYIDKAKNKSVVAETRQAVMATQTLVDEAYGNSGKASGGEDTLDSSITEAKIEKLAEVEGKVDTAQIDISGGKVKTLVYVNKNGDKKCTYSSTAQTGSTDGKYNVEDVTK